MQGYLLKTVLAVLLMLLPALKGLPFPLLFASWMARGRLITKVQVVMQVTEFSITIIKCRRQ
jgi:hypothetical protein